MSPLYKKTRSPKESEPNKVTSTYLIDQIDQEICGSIVEGYIDQVKNRFLDMKIGIKSFFNGCKDKKDK